MTAPEPTRPADEHTGTVALDLDAIEAAALADDGWWSVPVLALVAEVRSLRAKVAAVEAVERGLSEGWVMLATVSDRAEFVRTFRAALATTGEGKHVAREVFTAEGIANSSDYGTGYQDGQSDELASIADTCCGKCPGGTCYVDQVTGA